MAYTFTIGEPYIEAEDYTTGPELVTLVSPIETPTGEEPVHTDPYEMEGMGKGSGRRCPSFRTWSEVTSTIPEFNHLWYTIREYATERHEPAYIPVKLYADQLDEVEDAALSALDDEETEPVAQRVLWFVRWSRYAREELGDMAAFHSDEPLAYRRV